MTNKACDRTRRHLLKGLAATSLLGPLGLSQALAVTNKRLYIDGLSFLPNNLTDIRASKLDAYLCDISAIETIEQTDGTINYKRTFDACMASIKKRTTSLTPIQAY